MHRTGFLLRRAKIIRERITNRRSWKHSHSLSLSWLIPSSKILRASRACCGTTPFPQAFSSSFRDNPQSVIHPSGRPIIHSVNALDKRCAPSLPSGFVGAGAGRPKISSHRAMAGANFPQSMFSAGLRTISVSFKLLAPPGFLIGLERHHFVSATYPLCLVLAIAHSFFS